MPHIKQKDIKIGVPNWIAEETKTANLGDKRLAIRLGNIL